MLAKVCPSMAAISVDQVGGSEDGGLLPPAEEEVPGGQAGHQGRAQPRIVRHEDQHEQVGERHLQQVQQRLREVGPGPHVGPELAQEERGLHLAGSLSGVVLLRAVPEQLQLTFDLVNIDLVKNFDSANIWLLMNFLLYSTSRNTTIIFLCLQFSKHFSAYKLTLFLCLPI